MTVEEDSRSARKTQSSARNTTNRVKMDSSHKLIYLKMQANSGLDAAKPIHVQDRLRKPEIGPEHATHVACSSVRQLTGSSRQRQSSLAHSQPMRGPVGRECTRVTILAARSRCRVPPASTRHQLLFFFILPQHRTRSSV